MSTRRDKKPAGGGLAGFVMMGRGVQFPCFMYPQERWLSMGFLENVPHFHVLTLRQTSSCLPASMKIPNPEDIPPCFG